MVAVVNILIAIHLMRQLKSVVWEKLQIGITSVLTRVLLMELVQALVVKMAYCLAYILKKKIQNFSIFNFVDFRDTLG